jgi:hypothetical protein
MGFAMEAVKSHDEFLKKVSEKEEIKTKIKSGF